MKMAGGSKGGAKREEVRGREKEAAGSLVSGQPWVGTVASLPQSPRCGAGSLTRGSRDEVARQ